MSTLTLERMPAPAAVRAPESEIYGRSLGTIRRLGAFMLETLTESQVINSPEAAQAKVEFFTSVEEGFGTDMELGGGLEVRDFDTRPVVNGRVMSKDLKTAISGMTESGLACAKETALKDARFNPQLTRSVWDHKNALIVDRMVRGETDYNVRIVASPFPEEGAAQSGDAYWRKIGYVPHLRRGFVQLYVATKDGLVTGSLSFDGSDKRRLKELFGQYGVHIPDGEVTDNWLKYALTATLSADQAKALATEIANKAGDPRYKKNVNTVDVTKQYRVIMERAFNESYVHICESLVRGRQTAGAKALILQLADKARHFNERYAEALYRMRANEGQFTDDDSVVLHELLVYSTIEMMRALHLQERALQQGVHGGDTAYLSAAALQSAGAAQFQNMLGGFGADGARNNRVYSACGNEIKLGNKSLGDDPLTENERNPQDVFGGQDEDPDKKRARDEDGLGSRWFKCAKGHQNYRRVANVKEKRCSRCSVRVDCEAPETPPQKAEQPPTWNKFLGLGRKALTLAA